MKREFLEKLGIEDKEMVDKIMAEHGKGVESAKADMSAKESELEKVQEQLSSANKTIESYKDMNIEDIKKSAEEWESKAKDLETELTETRNNALLDKNLASINTHDADMLKKALNHEEIIFKDGEIIGLDKQIESLKESKAYLFKDEPAPEDSKPDGMGGIGGLKPHVPQSGGGSGTSGMQAILDSVFDN